MSEPRPTFKEQLTPDAFAEILVNRALRAEAQGRVSDETRRLAEVALRESEGQPIAQDWQEAALKVCRAVAGQP